VPDIEEVRKSVDHLKEEHTKHQMKFTEWHTKLRADLDNLLEAHKDRWVNCGAHKSGMDKQVKYITKEVNDLKISVGVNTKIIGIAIVIIPIIVNVIFKLVG